jgi:hypothetical protein
MTTRIEPQMPSTSDPMVEALRIFYHRGLVIRSQQQAEQPVQPTTPCEETGVDRASDALTGEPDAQ